MSKIKVTQIKSTIDQDWRKKSTIRALGLRRLHASVELEATPQVMGMLVKVKHLVKVEPK